MVWFHTYSTCTIFSVSICCSMCTTHVKQRCICARARLGLGGCFVAKPVSIIATILGSLIIVGWVLHHLPPATLGTLCDYWLPCIKGSSLMQGTRKLYDGEFIHSFSSNRSQEPLGLVKQLPASSLHYCCHHVNDGCVIITIV